ncbi:Vacuolar membrane protease [Dermatophagoides pteronyssinus]|uniref:Vacuolar membrane protease n=1 Tax=Dermatophagoides pteronyssinus TaxID=6956 RepID=A0ABQ8JL95_DERPT|nr:Vacuolar membrane protease [Dermatophagoides pteronyssinus]
MSTVDLELNDDNDDHVNETKNLYKNSLSMIINETKESNLKSSIMTNNNNIDNQTTTTKSSSFVIEQQIKHSANNHYHHYNNHHLSMDVKEEIQSLVIWRRPLQTIYHAIKNFIDLLNNCYTFLIIHHLMYCVSMTIFILIFFIALQLNGLHQPYVQFIYKRLAWCIYWCGLGILSSVGLGTGLHTFILYLGPHIASVTLAAYECNSLDFPEPPYPDEIICPTNVAATATTAAIGSSINVWSIMSKVRLEAFMWGAGTALGELPPYFISRAHRLAIVNQGHQDIDVDNDNILEELEEIEDLVTTTNVDNDDDGDNGGDQQQQQESTTNIERSRRRRQSSSASTISTSWGQKLKTKMVLLMKRMGFFGILACASIPNPLFDLAGIICGYSLISFWTFFGATLLGKAIFKMHIQKLVVIIVFNETYVQSVLTFCRNIPYIGHYIHEPLRDYLQQQKNSLHRGTNQMLETKGQSWISIIFESFVIIMVTYFMISIINSMAQSNLKQYYQQKQKQQQQKSDDDKMMTTDKFQQQQQQLKTTTTTNISPKKLDKTD